MRKQTHPDEETEHHYNAKSPLITALITNLPLPPPAT